jgi:hypothetical protein
MRKVWHHLEAVPATAAGPDDLRVPVMTIDAILERERYEPDLIKLDVEGYELQAVRGASGFLRRNPVDLFIEIHPDRIAETELSADGFARRRCKTSATAFSRRTRGTGAPLRASEVADRLHTNWLFCSASSTRRHPRRNLRLRHRRPVSAGVGTRDMRGLNAFFICTGVGIYNAGIDRSSARRTTGCASRSSATGITARLFKGGETDLPERRETRLWCLPRTGRASALLGKVLRRPPYCGGADDVFCPGSSGRSGGCGRTCCTTATTTWRCGCSAGEGASAVPYRLLYSNGAPLHRRSPRWITCSRSRRSTTTRRSRREEPESKTLARAIRHQRPGGRAGETTTALQKQIRQRLVCRVDRRIVISVGAINDYHKRMDYTVREVAAMPAADAAVPRAARRVRAADAGRFWRWRTNCSASRITRRGRCRTPRWPTTTARRTSFVLSSLKEGFGRVYLESLIHGLPTIGHDHACNAIRARRRGASSRTCRSGAGSRRC